MKLISWTFNILLIIVIHHCYAATILRRRQTEINDSENLIEDDNISKTIFEVEQILKKDPSLPRLTRGEILRLIEEVKSNETSSLNQNKRGNKSIVVVMPYNVDNSNTSIQELYTKAPVTEVITVQGEEVSTTRKPMKKRRRKPTSPRPVYVHSTDNIKELTNLQDIISPVSTSTATTTLKNVFIPTYVTTETIKPTSVKTKSTTKFVPTTDGGWLPIQEDFQLVGPFKQTLEDISVRPVTERPIFVTISTQHSTVKPPQLPDVSAAAESLTPDLKELLVNFGLLEGKKKVEPTTLQPQTTPKYEFNFGGIQHSIDPSSYLNFKPLPVQNKPISNDEINSDMRNFLASFGLLPDPRKRSKAVNIHNRPYLESESQIKDTPEINSDILNDNMKVVLTDLGFMDLKKVKKSKKLGGDHIFNPAEHTAKLSNIEQLQRISKLLEKIKVISKNDTALSADDLENLLVTELGQDGRDILNNLKLDVENNFINENKTLLVSESPDPLAIEELVDMVEKNEVKRQQPNNSNNVVVSSSASSSASSDGIFTNSSSSSSVNINSSNNSTLSSSASGSSGVSLDTKNSDPSIPVFSSASASSSSASASSSSSSVSASSETSSNTDSSSEDQIMTSDDSGPSFDDLNDSFGGEVSTSKPNGLYFLLDWNSFLQVGEDDEDVGTQRRINLNFSPKVGDPKNFLPVTIP